MKMDEWISVMDQLPDDSQDVLIVMAKFKKRYPEIKIAWFDIIEQKWKNDKSDDINDNSDYYTSTQTR